MKLLVNLKNVLSFPYVQQCQKFNKKLSYKCAAVHNTDPLLPHKPRLFLIFNSQGVEVMNALLLCWQTFSISWQEVHVLTQYEHTVCFGVTS